jgi:hypothetical protein
LKLILAPTARPFVQQCQSVDPQSTLAACGAAVDINVRLWPCLFPPHRQSHIAGSPTTRRYGLRVSAWNFSAASPVSMCGGSSLDLPQTGDTAPCGAAHVVGARGPLPGCPAMLSGLDPKGAGRVGLVGKHWRGPLFRRDQGLGPRRRQRFCCWHVSASSRRVGRKCHVRK